MRGFALGHSAGGTFQHNEHGREVMAQQDAQPAAFSRGPSGTTAELRGDCPREILNVLDAVSLARNKTRIALVNEILGAWAEKVTHEAMLVSRVAAGNPPLAEARRSAEKLS
jgi:hypothetical protein